MQSGRPVSDRRTPVNRMAKGPVTDRSAETDRTWGDGLSKLAA